MFPILAIAVFAATYLQLLAFTVMGERLTCRIRNLAFTNIMRQDIAWFDREDNSTGACVCACLLISPCLSKACPCRLSKVASGPRRLTRLPVWHACAVQVRSARGWRRR
jgi:ABC-type multidrug transport system fused ATPase/permease subunit